MKYRMYFAFLDKNGFVESDGNGEVVYCAEVVADDPLKAVEKLEQKERFVSKAQIIDIVGVKDGNN